MIIIIAHAFRARDYVPDKCSRVLSAFNGIMNVKPQAHSRSLTDTGVPPPTPPALLQGARGPSGPSWGEWVPTSQGSLAGPLARPQGGRLCHLGLPRMLQAGASQGLSLLTRARVIFQLRLIDHTVFLRKSSPDLLSIIFIAVVVFCMDVPYFL